MTGFSVGWQDKEKIKNPFWHMKNEIIKNILPEGAFLMFIYKNKEKFLIK